ncbi:hypothetical protein DAI22_08g105300 [Oryza sativa Japonica Group]|uniref:Uncharacterized protein n=1 Tax=Oryza barthii TaxID=65489 RepID=A0A0D3GYL7_9ORYZ|nr:hypothetical protein DAI22_08g105300 [Oryza sativa Japonica Group]
MKRRPPYPSLGTCHQPHRSSHLLLCPRKRDGEEEERSARSSGTGSRDAGFGEDGRGTAHAASALSRVLDTKIRRQVRGSERFMQVGAQPPMLPTHTTRGIAPEALSPDDDDTAGRTRSRSWWHFPPRSEAVDEGGQCTCPNAACGCSKGR